MSILYIYGWGLVPALCPTLEYLRAQLDTNILSEEYDQFKPAASIAYFEEYISTKRIDTVIASSYGAFIALNISQPIKKILLNPCLRPSTEIPKLDETAQNQAFIDNHVAIESALFNKKFDNPQLTTAFFSANDTLFSYKAEYLALGYSKYIDLPDQAHRLNAAGLDVIISITERS
ncbi:MAG: hypothetical protein LBV04_09385 [Deferribacteraceae bacterium]|jgi:predicted esterase YcpF (UPF0227 family)|nr:hypothetical protein [Deferribacteraceae bacterium]